MRLRTIGGLSIDGENAPQLGPKQLALLAVVATAGKAGITRERVVGILWGETGEEQARHTLSQTLYNIRRAVGRDLIVGSGQLRLDPSLASDIEELRNALRAGEPETVVQLYSGKFLEGFYIPGALEFERWVDEQRTGLEADVTRALERLAKRAEEEGRTGDAVRWWQRLGELDALSARYVSGHMRALAAAGDLSAALGRARLYRETVQRELGAEPDPAIQRLEAELREAAARASASASARVDGSAVAPPPTPASARADSEATPPPPRESRAPRWLLLPLVAAGVITIALVVRGFGGGSEHDPPFLAVGEIRVERPADSTSSPRILRDMLATSLGGIAGLQVVANSRLIELMPRGADTIPGATSDAARRAGATEILEGELLPGTAGLSLALRRVSLTSGVVRQGYTVRAIGPSQLIDSAAAAIARDLRLAAPSTTLATIRTSSPAAYALYEEGLRAYYTWDAAAAYRLMKAAVARDSAFAMAAFYGWWASRAVVAHPEGDRELLARAKRLAPLTIDRERLLIGGSVATMDASLTTQLAVAETLSVRYPEDPDGQILLGAARQANGDWAGAIAAYERTVAIDSMASAAPQSYCRMCLALGSMVSVFIWWDSAGAAERTARRFIALRPENEMAWNGLVEPRLRLRKRAEALAAIQKRDSLTRTGSSFRGVLQRDLIRWGHFEEVDRQLFEDVADPSVSVRGEGRWLMLFSLRNQGRLREAMALARDLIIPGSANRIAGLEPEGLTQFTLLLEGGQPRAAAAHFRRIAATTLSQDLTPGFKARFATWMLALAGAASAAAGDTAGLQRLADSAEQIGKGSNWGRDPRLHHYLRGMLLQQRGQHAAAVEEFRRAVFSTTDGFTRINLEMAKSLLALGRAPEAVAILQPALRGNVDGSNTYLTHTELHEAIAQAFEQAHQTDSARVHWRAVESAWRRADPQFRDRYLRAKERAGL